MFVRVIPEVGLEITRPRPSASRTVVAPTVGVVQLVTVKPPSMVIGLGLHTVWAVPPW
jgi:hypothetical protein